MSFRISNSEQNGISLVNLHHNDSQTIVSIVPAYGAMLHAFSTPIDGSAFNIIDNYSSAADIAANLGNSYKSSKLSPFPCRIENGRYRFEGKDYQFEKLFSDGTAIHGLLADKAFRQLKGSTAEFLASASFIYEYRADDPGYPFNYDCQINYTLLPQHLLQVQTILTNRGSETIPIGDGWHPYFSLGGKVDDYQLQFASDGMLEFNSKLIPTGKIISSDDFRTGTRIGDRQMDNCFVLDKTTYGPVCILRNTATGCQLEFETDGQYPYLQIYIPPHRNSIAIENLSTAPDAFNNGMGLLLLAPGEEKSLTVFYRINTGESA